MQDLGDRLQGKALHDVLGPPCTESLLTIEQTVTNAMKNILSRLKESQDYSASVGPGNGEMSATLDKLGELTKVLWHAIFYTVKCLVENYRIFCIIIVHGRWIAYFYVTLHPLWQQNLEKSDVVLNLTRMSLKLAQRIHKHRDTVKALVNVHRTSGVGRPVTSNVLPSQ